MPTAQELIQQLQGSKVTAEELLARAKKPEQPKGKPQFLPTGIPAVDAAKRAVHLLSLMGRPAVDELRRAKEAYAFPLTYGKSEDEHSMERVSAGRRYSQMGPISRADAAAGRMAMDYVLGATEFATQGFDPVINPEMHQGTGQPTGVEALSHMGADLPDMVFGAPAQFAELSRLMMGRNNTLATALDAVHYAINWPRALAGESPGDFREKMVERFYENPAEPIYGVQMGAHAMGRFGVGPADIKAAIKDRIKADVVKRGEMVPNRERVPEALKGEIRERLASGDQSKFNLDRTATQKAIDEAVSQRSGKSAKLSAEAMEERMGKLGPETASERVSAKQASDLKSDLKARQERAVSLREASTKAIEEELKRRTENAKGLRKDEGQVQKGGDVGPGGEAEGSANLEQPTPKKPGGPEAQKVKPSKKPKKVTPYEYVKTMEEVSAQHPNVHQVTPPAAKDLMKAQKGGGSLILSGDKKAGVVVKPDGEVGHLFSAPSKGLGAGRRLVALFGEAVKRGGKWGESFNTYLPALYGKVGFKPVAKIKFVDEFAPKGWPYEQYKQWQGGRPDVVFYARDGVRRAPAETAKIIRELEYSADYDVAAGIAKGLGTPKMKTKGKGKIVSVAKALGATAFGAAVTGIAMKVDEKTLDKIIGEAGGVATAAAGVALAAAGGSRKRPAITDAFAKNVKAVVKKKGGITLDINTMKPTTAEGYVVSVLSYNTKLKDITRENLQKFLDQHAKILDKHGDRLTFGMWSPDEIRGPESKVSVDLNAVTKTRQAAEHFAVKGDQSSIGRLTKKGKKFDEIWIGGKGETPVRNSSQVGRVLTNIANADKRELSYIGAAILSDTGANYKTWLKRMKGQVTGEIANPKELFAESKKQLTELLSTSTLEKFPQFRELAKAFRENSWNAAWYKRVKGLIEEIYPSMAEKMLKVYAYIQSGVDPKFAANHTMKTWAHLQSGRPLSELKVGFKNAKVTSKAVRAILNDEIVYPIEGRKLRDFYRTLARLDGAETTTVIDMHMARLFGFGDAPKLKGQYTFIETALRDAASRLKRTPEEVQASLWAYQKLKTDVAGEGLLGIVLHADQSFLKYIDAQFAKHGMEFVEKGLEKLPEGVRLTRVSPVAKTRRQIFDPANETLRTKAGGAEDARIAKDMVARLNMYADHAIIERSVAAKANQVLQAQIRKGRIYDLTADPVNFKLDARIEVNKGQYITDMNKLESHIRNAGYAGYTTGDGAIVVVFEPLKMKHVGEFDIFTNLKEPIKKLWPLGAIGVSFIPYFLDDDGETRYSPAMAMMGLAFLSRGKSEAAPRVSRRIDISPLKGYYDAISASKELRPGFKLPTSELISIRRAAAESLGIELKMRADGALVAPKGYGKALSAAMKIELIRRKMALAQQEGVAIRVTKSGTPVPNVKKSGVMVPVEFAEYKNFRDVRKGSFGGTKDITRGIQEIDGMLSLEEKAKMPGQAGPAERMVLWRERELVTMRDEFVADMTRLLKSILDGKSKSQRIAISHLLERMSNRAAYIAPEKLAAGRRFSKITTNIETIKAAQDLRKVYDTMRVRVNEMRRMRGQAEIPYRKYYSPNYISEVSLWERTFGLKKETVDIVRGPELPDYIKPEAAFNPHAMAREANLPHWMREMDAAKLAERYVNVAAKDMFNTSIIQNHKAFAAQLETMGFPNSAALIRDHAAEVYGGVKAHLDRAAALHPTVSKGMRLWRGALARSVFPLNVSWNMFVQTSSGVLTYARYGGKNCLLGAKDWFFDKKVRGEIVDTYSYRIKNDQMGRITHQDIHATNASLVKLKKNAFETAADAFSYLNEVVERHLTGWSAAAARRQGLKAGLRGEALKNFASDGGAKTQSMYNAADLPGMLRSEIVKTVAPFQTFSFELFNTMRELGGRTGMSMGTWKRKAMFVTRLVGGALAVNYIGSAAIGRKPWELGSFIPFYNSVISPIVAGLTGDEGPKSGRALPSPIGAGIELTKGIRRYFMQDDISGLRKWMIRYGLPLGKVPGGTQMSRMVDGIIAVSEEGVYDSLERLKFPVSGAKEQITAILAGPYATNAGQKYLDEKKSTIFDMFADKSLDSRYERQRTRVKNLVKNGRYGDAAGAIDEWNSVYANTEFQMSQLADIVVDVQKQQLRDLIKKSKEGTDGK